MIGDHDDWAFNFVGVGIDEWHARQVGIPQGAVARAPRTNAGLDNAFRRLSIATKRYVNAPKSEKAALSKGFYLDLQEEEEDIK